MGRFMRLQVVAVCLACIPAAWLILPVLPAHAAEQQPNQEQLEKLAWIIGTWVHRGRSADGEPLTVTRKYQWVLDENYITCFSTIRVGREIKLAHRHMIGWDSDKKVYRSWVFSSNGDFVRGVWPDLDDNRRAGTLAGETPNGERISAKAVYTREGDNTLRYDVTEYTIGGDPQPSMRLIFHRLTSNP